MTDPLYHLGNPRTEVLQKSLDLLWNSRLQQSLAGLEPHRDENAWALSHFCEGLMLNTMFLDSGYDVALDMIGRLENMISEVLSRYNGGVVGYVTSMFRKKEDPVLAALDPFKRDLVEVECMGLLAECYANYAFLYFRKDSFVKAGYYGRRAWKQYVAAERKLTEMREKYSVLQMERARDIAGMIKMGLGVFHFAISLTPPSMMWIVEIIGFKGDRMKGIQEMRETVAANCPRSLHASIFLIGVERFFFKNSEESDRLIESVLKRYPESAPIEALIAFLQRYEYRVHDAKETYRQCIAHASPELHGLAIAAKYELSCCHWFLCEYEPAIALMEEYLDNGPSQFRAHLAWKLGFCYWAIGRKDKIPDLYRRLEGWIKPNMSFDKFASRRAKLFLSSGNRFDAFEEAFIPAFNLYQAGEYDRALSALEAIPAILKSSYEPVTPKQDSVAMYRYAKGCVLQRQGRYDKARPHFQKVVDLEPKISQENWIVPLSFIGMAEMDRELGDIDAALITIAKAKAYSRSYDLDKPIAVQLMMLTEHCNASK